MSVTPADNLNTSAPSPPAAGAMPAAAARASLLRVNTAAAVIVVVVIALAVAAVMAAIASARDAARASEAQARAQGELWASYLAQARAGRLSGLMGQRAQGLAAISAASRIAGSRELRNEAIAHLALRDLTPSAPFIQFTNATTTVINNAGTHAAISHSDRRLQILHLGTTQQVVNVRPSPSIRPFLFSPEDSLLAGSDSRSQLAIVHASSGSVLWRRADWRAVDFMPDSRIAAVINRDGGNILFLNATSGVEVLPPMPIDPAAFDLAISPAADRIALAFPDHVLITPLPSQPSTLNSQPSPRLSLASKPSTMAWGGDWLAIGQHGGQIELWHAPDGRSYRLREHKALVSNLCFNRRGDLLVSVAYDGSSKLWSTYSAREILSTTLGFGLRFSDNEQRLVFRTRNGIGSWAVSHPHGYREIHLADSPASQFHADFSEDGQYLAVSKHDGLRLVHLPSGNVVARQPFVRGRAAYFLAQNRLLTCGDMRLSIWPLEVSSSASGDVALGEPEHITLPSQEHVDTPTINPARTHVALPISHTSAMLLEIDNPQHRVIVSNTPNPTLTTVSPDGRWLVTGTFHGSKGTRLWDANTGRLLRDLAPDNASVFFNPSPERQMLLVAGNREYLFFDTKTWAVRHRVPTESAGDLPNTAAFTTDGLTVAITTARSSIQLIDTRTFTPLATLTGPENNVVSWLAFDRAGETLAAVMTSDVVELWNLRELRRRLHPLGLDWSQPARPSPPAFATHDGITGLGLSSRAQPSGHARVFSIAAVAAVLLVVACSAFVLRRQRRLLAQYFEADKLVAQRNRELSIAQAEIMHGQKMKALGTLAAGIAHDFNNLLSVVRMSNKLIAREAAGNTEIIENTAEIEHAVRQGKTVVRSMLGYSRETPQGGQMGSVAELVEDTVGLLSRQFLSGIALQLEIEPTLPRVHVSQGKLEQILLNLIVNASEAMDGKGSLRITVREIPALAMRQPPLGPPASLPARLRPIQRFNHSTIHQTPPDLPSQISPLTSPTAGAVAVSPSDLPSPISPLTSLVVLRPRNAECYIGIGVADSGPGIAPDVLPRIFEPFFTTKNVGASRGTGLGLSMVHTMSEQEGIGIAVQTSPGTGTVFELLVPVTSKTDPIAAAPPLTHPVRQSHTVNSP